MGGSSITPTSAEEAKTKKNYKLWLKIEVTFLSVLIIGVWSLLSLPIMFYYLPISETTTRGITNTTSASVCSAPIQYATTGGICGTEFANILTSSNCPPDPEGNTLVVKNEEATAAQLIGGLMSIGASDECIRRAVPFLCLHLFGLCGGLGVSIQPTVSQCEEVRDTQCQDEWMFVETLGIDLPDCGMFPANISSCPALNDSLPTNEMVSRMMSENHPNQTRVAVLECSDGFYREKSSILCTPSCYTWLQYSKALSILSDVVVFIAALIGVISAVAVILISFMRRKRMFNFPSIFIVYQVTDLLALGTFVIVNYMDRNRLFCSSRSLIESLREVTPFCVISGILFTYVVCQLALWWLFHTVSLFWKVKFPFHARSFEMSGKVKYIHITCVIAGILLPLLPIITSMAKFAMDIRKQNEKSTSQIKNDLFLSGGLGFTTSRFPSILCAGRDQDVIFYTVVLPINIILASGCTILINIFWSVHKQNIKLTAHGSSNPFKFGTAEKKLLIVFCYYVILAVVALTAFTLGTRHAPTFVKNVQRYFFCEQRGHNPSMPCNRSDFEKHTFPFVTTLSYISLALFPVVNLLYAVNIQELKELWGKWLKNRKSIFTDTPSTGSAIVMTSTLKRGQ